MTTVPFPITQANRSATYDRLLVLREAMPRRDGWGALLVFDRIIG